MKSHMDPIHPDTGAEELATRMLDDDETQKEIIAETLEASESGQIKESGRTACGGGRRIIGPKARHPSSVSLATCPLSRGGAWHTHVTPEEVRNPQNSIPDMANVVYGLLDVSVVSGTQSSEVMMRAENPDRMVNEFENILGIEAQGPSDIVDALMDGTIRDPPAVRERIRSAMPELFKRRSNTYPDLDWWAGEVEYGMASLQMHQHECVMYSTAPGGSVGDQIQGSFDSAREVVRALSDKTETPIRGVIVSTAVGTIVGRVITKSLFDD